MRTAHNTAAQVVAVGGMESKDTGDTFDDDDDDDDDEDDDDDDYDTDDDAFNWVFPLKVCYANVHRARYTLARVLLWRHCDQYKICTHCI